MFEVLTVLVQALVLVVFLNRYAGKFFLWAFRSKKEKSEYLEGFEPTVTVVVPLFNEGESIRGTIRSLLEQDYASEKLEIIIVDDCSTDGSHRHAVREAKSSPRVRVLRNPKNIGKRRSINRAVRMTDAEIIVSVDSDVLVESDAIRLLVREFTTPDMAAVGGRVDVANKHDSWLTRMQGVKYFFSYYFTKGLEPAFKSVMCLSGCLTAYRRSVLLELEPILEARALLGVPIKYGEDRFLTRQIIKAGYKTTMTLDAACKTAVPDKIDQYLSQQLRWRRSNYVDYVSGLSHVWRQHPAIAIQFVTIFASFLLYPTVVAHALFAGWFLKLLVAHLGLGAVMGLIYAVMSRRFPEEERIGPLNIASFVLAMPITYCALVPLAIFTLDSGCWETRDHVDETVPVPEPQEVPLATPGLSLAPVIGINEGKNKRKMYRRLSGLSDGPSIAPALAREQVVGLDRRRDERKARRPA